MNPWDEAPAKRRNRRIRTAVILLLPAVWLTAAVLMTVQPVFGRYPHTVHQVDPRQLRSHVTLLSETCAPRNFLQTDHLDRAADYIAAHFAQTGGRVSEQSFQVEGRTYRNVTALFGPPSESRIVVGAHYDSFGETPGADDNASGVAGLLELARLLGRAPPEQQVELVAFTLEEPPFFRTPHMGSARHAQELHSRGAKVEAMICLEMIGCFSDEAGSQRFPSLFLRWLYPDRGNFIGIIGSYGDRKVLRRMKAAMRGATDLPVHALCRPKGMPGIDFSDHLNYWNQGYRAVMITDTAFMRNRRYHTTADTADTLDYDRMAKVVLCVYEAVLQLARDQK